MGVIGGWSPLSWPFFGLLMPVAITLRTSSPHSGLFCCCFSVELETKQHKSLDLGNDRSIISTHDGYIILQQIEVFRIQRRLGSRITYVSLSIKPLRDLHSVLRTHSQSGTRDLHQLHRVQSCRSRFRLFRTLYTHYTELYRILFVCVCVCEYISLRFKI